MPALTTKATIIKYISLFKVQFL